MMQFHLKTLLANLFSSQDPVGERSARSIMDLARAPLDSLEMVKLQFDLAIVSCSL
jgi:hypothetical protein